MGAVAVGCAVAAATAHAAAAPTTFRDQDATPVPAGTPDIAAVAVTNDATTAIFVASFAVQPTAGSPWYGTLFIDTDQNPTTGDTGDSGVELAIDYSASDNSFGVYAWNGSTWAIQSGTGTRMLGAAGTLSWIVPRTLLGTASGFNFWVRAGVDGRDDLYDEAPDTSTWNYQLQKDAPSVPTATSAPAAFQLTPATAVMGAATAGSKWSASLEVTRSDTGGDLGAEGHVTCKATVGTTTLKATHAGFTTSGTHTVAVCTWALPASAHGKTIHAVVGASYKGVSASHTFTKIAV